MSKLRVGVIGAGALGLYYGGLLQRAGHEVIFLLRRDFEAIHHHGLTVTSPNGDFHLSHVQGHRDPGKIGPVDLVLVGLKTFDNDRLIELAMPLIGAGTAVLTLQNGLGNEEILAAAFGEEKILGGVAFLCANRGSPGTVHHLGQGSIRLGEFGGGLSERACSLSDMFNAAGVSCEAVGDLNKARWEKLVWNIPFNGLCALTGLTTDRILAHPPIRHQAVEIMSEVITAANLQGLSEPIDTVPFITCMFELTETMDDYRPSMMIDRLEKRPLELDAIYGIPLRKAAEKGATMVRTELLHALLGLTETGQRQVI